MRPETEADLKLIDTNKRDKKWQESVRARIIKHFNDSQNDTIEKVCQAIANAIKYDRVDLRSKSEFTAFCMVMKKSNFKSDMKKLGLNQDMKKLKSFKAILLSRS